MRISTSNTAKVIGRIIVVLFDEKLSDLLHTLSLALIVKQILVKESLKSVTNTGSSCKFYKLVRSSTKLRYLNTEHASFPERLFLSTWPVV